MHLAPFSSRSAAATNPCNVVGGGAQRRTAEEEEEEEEEEEDGEEGGGGRRRRTSRRRRRRRRANIPKRPTPPSCRPPKRCAKCEVHGVRR